MSRSPLAEVLSVCVPLFAVACAPTIEADNNRLSIGTLPTALPVTSMYERRFSTVVRQQFDFSCGSAALATLLQFHYGQRVDERTTFVGMYESGDQASIKRLGFSLLDMKRYLAARGMAADGYKVSLEQIAATRLPGIALIDSAGYKHFVVVKGIEPGLSGPTVLLGDPATGLRRMNADEFVKAWNGVLFVLNVDSPMAKESFARDTELALAPGAQTTLQMEPISQQALALTRPIPGDL